MKIKTWRLGFSGIILLAIVFVLAIVNRPTIDTNHKLIIVSSTTQLADITKNIVGDNFDIITLMKVNIDPHEYEPTSADAQAIAKANLIIKNGLGLDRRIDNIISSNATTAEVITAADFTTANINDNPHIWFSVNNVKAITNGIRAAVIDVDPNHRSIYETNSQNYLNKLTDLDNYIRRQVSLIPEDKRKLVLDHDTLTYFARDYKFKIVGLITDSASTDAQPSAQTLRTLIEKIKNEQIKVIFSETTSNPQLAEQVATASGAKVVGNLYIDTLSNNTEPAATYIDMMRYDTDTIISNLKN